MTTLTEAYVARLEFYDKNQPRAKDGKWSRGGSSGPVGGDKSDKVWSGVSAHPDRRTKPKVNHQAMDHMRNDPEGFAYRVFNASLGGGYSARVTAVDPFDSDTGMSVHVTGLIQSEGKKVGEFIRTINYEHGDLSVHHDELVIDPKHQGGGVADRFNAHAVAQYQRMGADRITLEAGLEVGAYAWARQGFRYNEYDGERSRHEYVSSVLDAVENSAKMMPIMRPHKAQLLKETRALRKASEAGEDVQPIHLASIGETYARYTDRDNSGREYTAWPGKRAILPRHWDGVYYFDAANPLTAAATSLEHGALRPAFGMSAALTEALACHTAACRPPSSGGTGGSLKSGVLPDVAASDVRFAYRPRHPDGHADPGEVVWARVPFEEDPTQGKDRPVLIVGRASNGNLVGVQLTSKTHHKGSFPVEWGSDKASHLRPERFIQVDLKNYRKEGAYIKKPVFQEIVNSLAKTHGLATQELSALAVALACHDASCRPPTSGGTGGSSKKSTVGFSGQSPTRTGRIRPTQRIKKLDSATLDELGWPEDGSTKSRAEAFIKSWFDPELPDGHTVKVKVVKLSDSQWSVEGRIQNKNGRMVGDFERDIDFDKQMVQKGVGGTVVMHEGLHLDMYAQGLGIGAILNGHAVAAYKKYGVDHVQVHAGDTVGGYAWAVAGFRINEPQTDRHGAIGQFASKGDRTLDELNAGAYLTTAQVEQAKKEIGALVQASWAGKDVQPIHIASVGEETMRFKKTNEAGVEYDTWPGKEVMLRTNWFGVYYFGDPITASAFVKALEFACHDASCRPPTSGGTGGSLKLRGGVSVPAPRRSNPKCVPEPCVGESIERAGTIGRKLMHRALINSTLRGGTPPPTVTILGGGGGSGKTTVADALGLKREHESTINADDIKEKIPEYKTLVAIGDHTAAAFVHEESSKITKEAQAESRRRGIGVTLDQVGSDPVKLSAQIDSYVAAGYKDIRAVYIAVDTNVAVERAMTRGARTGRVVPKPVLEAAHREVSLNFERIASNPKIGEIQLIDNNGDKPFLIAKGGGGKPLEILNQEAYTRFLDKGGV